MHVLWRIGVIDGVSEKAALIQGVPQARANALDMLAQERAPALRLGAIGLSRKSRRMIELAIVCNCDCWAVYWPWLVQIKRLSTSDRSDATRPTTKPTMPFDWRHRRPAAPNARRTGQRADEGRDRHDRGAIDENHGALPCLGRRRMREGSQSWQALACCKGRQRAPTASRSSDMHARADWVSPQACGWGRLSAGRPVREKDEQKRKQVIESSGCPRLVCRPNGVGVAQRLLAHGRPADADARDFRRSSGSSAGQ